FELWSGPETVYVVNDNEGRLFDFEKVSGATRETWVTREGLTKSRIPLSILPVGGVVDRRALASVKPTDVLVLGIASWPAGTCAMPQRVQGRAALYSFGFLFRRAAADRLDIDERELRVGLRIRQDPNAQVIGELFLSDSLENGAGYSSYYGNPQRAEDLIRFIVGPNTPFSDVLVGAAHAAICETSCADCLRDFSNLAYHNILDWRLGLDVARLALDPAAAIDFSVPYWRGIDVIAADTYFRAMQWQR